MGRSKEKGKLVSELTKAELVSEQRRCVTRIRYSSKLVARLLTKRLHEIERRLAREEA